MLTRFWIVIVVVDLLLTPAARGDILHRVTGRVIPGTEGISPGPSLQLSSMQLAYADLAGWDLTDAQLHASDLSSSHLMAANLTKAQLQDSSLANANLAGVNLTEAWADEANLTGANLTGAVLEKARMRWSTFHGANLTSAIIRGADISMTTSRGFTAEQLYSTRSYEDRDLSWMNLQFNDFSGWHFAGQDLSHCKLDNTTLSGANLAGVNLFSASAEFATLSGANLRNANLFGAFFRVTSFSNADLKGANLDKTHLSTVDLRGADLKNSYFGSDEIAGAQFDASTIYNQWTVFPFGFDPEVTGLTFASSPAGDFDASGGLGVEDIDMFCQYYEWPWLNEMFDLNSDGSVSLADHRAWVKDLKRTWYGDANLDGEFNTGDLVQVLGSGRYERGWLDQWGYPQGEVASWSEGDWNGDGVFDTGDLVKALEDGGYEKGARMNAMAVPEPSSFLLTWIAMPLLLAFRRGESARC